MIPLRVLIVDDSEADAVLSLRELQRAGYSPRHKRVDTAEGMEHALSEQEWDIILCDHVMPHFGSTEALEVLHRKGKAIPLIIVSGQIGEDTAVQAMRAGASDYIMKDNLKRLGPAIERDLAEATNRLQRRKVEEELRAKEEELSLAKKIDLIKDEFIGMVSHELKTPLTVIIGALNVAMSEGVTQEQARELMGEAAISAEALSTMLDNLLELSRYQSNRLNLQAKQTRVEPVVQALVDKLRNRSPIHRIIVDIPSELPAVTIDAIRIERVLYNLIENAIKYSPKGGEVRICGCQKDASLVIGVSDQGIGIKPEDQSKLFQRFQRLDAQKKYNIAGVGLGLRVCQILVEAHAGRIWVESTFNKGSTFYFSLPVAGSKAQHLRRRESDR